MMKLASSPGSTAGGTIQETSGADRGERQTVNNWRQLEPISSCTKSSVSDPCVSSRLPAGVACAQSTRAHGTPDHRRAVGETRIPREAIACTDADETKIVEEPQERQPRESQQKY